eukprot:scaffold602_cov298-Pinguiococcus_pyrenoidosus.AAC.41
MQHPALPSLSGGSTTEGGGGRDVRPVALPSRPAAVRGASASDDRSHRLHTRRALHVVLSCRSIPSWHAEIQPLPHFQPLLPRPSQYILHGLRIGVKDEKMS